MKGRLSLDATHRSSPPEVFLRKGISIICCKFTREHPCWSAILIKLQSNFIEIEHRHGCSSVNLLHIFRTPFIKNTYGWQLLNNLSSRHNNIVFNKMLLIGTLRKSNKIVLNYIVENLNIFKKWLLNDITSAVDTTTRQKMIMIDKILLCICCCGFRKLKAAVMRVESVQ